MFVYTTEQKTKQKTMIIIMSALPALCALQQKKKKKQQNRSVIQCSRFAKRNCRSVPTNSIAIVGLTIVTFHAILFFYATIIYFSSVCRCKFETFTFYHSIEYRTELNDHILFVLVLLLCTEHTNMHMYMRSRVTYQ